MAAHPLWKGQLRLPLVSLAVELYSATRAGARISFRQIHEPSGKRIRYEKVVPGIGPVDKDDIMKGYEVEKDNFVLLEPEEVDAVKLESKKTFELVQFVGACEIAPLYFDRPYYLVPADELAEDAYRVVREALRGLIKQKTKSKSSKKVTPDEEEGPASTQDNVIDLMAALKKSLEKAPSRKKKKRKSFGNKQSSRKKKRA